MTTPQETVERALALSQADGCVVIVEEASRANLRWANTALTTNGVTRSRRLTITTVDGATETAAGVVSHRGAVGEELERLMRAAEAAARAGAAAADTQPLVTAGAAS